MTNFHLLVDITNLSTLTLFIAVKRFESIESKIVLLLPYNQSPLYLSYFKRQLTRITRLEIITKNFINAISKLFTILISACLDNLKVCTPILCITALFKCLLLATIIITWRQKRANIALKYEQLIGSLKRVFLALIDAVRHEIKAWYYNYKSGKHTQGYVVMYFLFCGIYQVKNIT